VVRTPLRTGRRGANIEDAGCAGPFPPPEEADMSTTSARPDPMLEADLTAARAVAETAARMWWLWLVTGAAWLVAALVILQFDQASVTTVGIIIGCMFVVAGVQQFALAAVAEHLRWLWIAFGVLFVICGILCFIEPKATFAGLADMLGFLFLVVGVWWTIGAILAAGRPLWWLGLISGILMCILAFWTSGQFLIDKAYLLLVFAGIWALMHGVTDFVKAFAVRTAHKELSR
jgi:uncharacterized membrane protein HdeD (DUF308 family)